MKIWEQATFDKVISEQELHEIYQQILGIGCQMI